MPLTNDFVLPANTSGLSLPDGPSSKLFLVFTTANDPATGASWCPDVRAALPTIQATFSPSDAPHAAMVEVGQLSEWRDKSNVFRTQWGISNIPAIVRFEKVDGQVAETGRLTEREILDEQKLHALLGRA